MYRGLQAWGMGNLSFSMVRRIAAATAACSSSVKSIVGNDFVMSLDASLRSGHEFVRLAEQANDGATFRARRSSYRWRCGETRSARAPRRRPVHPARRCGIKGYAVTDDR
jgi:hypothetical protein